MRPREPEMLGPFNVGDSGLPPRSRLFNLPPIGLGTDRVEGLVSYLVRLARAHSVNPRLLVKTEFVMVPGLEGMTHAAFFDRYAGTLDGLSRYAELFSATIGQLVGRDDLRFLTLLPLGQLLPANGQGLLAGRARWCPICLEEMIKTRGEAYRPLLWSFALYRFCTRHKCLLADRCATCGRLQPFLPRYPDFVRCDHCQASLSLPTERSWTEPSALDAWMSAAIENIVAHLGAIEGHVTRDRFVAAVVAATEKYASGNHAEFCRQIGLSRWATKRWLSQGEHPSLPQLLAVSYGLCAMPSELFLPAFAPVCGLRTLPDKVMNRAERPVLSAAARQRLESELARIVADPADTAPVAKIAQRVGLTRSCLKYWFPEHHERIHAKYQDARKHGADLALKRNAEKVLRVVTEMAERGEYPGRRRVNEALRKQGASLASPKMKAIYRHALLQTRAVVSRAGQKRRRRANHGTCTTTFIDGSPDGSFGELHQEQD
ncbi:MAG: TniQ family protein [Proteobacteria bacterium]|nr:TniQ family protein [Pseudomonadota bacterium]